MAEQTPKSTQTNHIRTPEIDAHATRPTNPISIPITATPTPVSSEGISQTNVRVDAFIQFTSVHPFYKTISLIVHFVFYSKLPRLENILCDRLRII